MTPTTLPNEKELVIQLNKRQQQAFEILYHRYKSRIAGNLLKLLKSEELAEETLQNLFIKIWDNRSQVDPEKSFRSYLFGIAENMMVDYYRKAARDIKARDKLMAVNSELYSHIEEDIFNKEDNKILQKAIDLLPPQRRQIFTLLIRHERRIEFAFEGTYYNDIRRRKTAETVMKGAVLNALNQPLVTRTFNPARDYCWPVPQTGVMYANLEQNPNY